MKLLSGHLSGSLTSSSRGPKADPSYHVVTSCFLFVSISFHWLFSHLCQKVVISKLQKAFGLLVSCWFVPPADITQWLKVHKDQDLQRCNFLQLAEEGLIYLSLLISRSIADTYNVTTFVCPLILTHNLLAGSWPILLQHFMYSSCSPT